MYSIPKKDSGSGFYEIMVAVVLGATGFFYRLYIMHSAWQWFAVPYGMKPISFWGMWVVGTMVWLGNPSSHATDPDKSPVTNQVGWLLAYASAHALLWLVAS